MPDPPTGTITFLFTDIEGSTNLLGRYADAVSLTCTTTRRRIVFDRLEPRRGDEAIAYVLA